MSCRLLLALALAASLLPACQESPQHPPSTTFGAGNAFGGLSPGDSLRGFHSGGITGSGGSLMSGFRPATPEHLSNGFRGF